MAGSKYYIRAHYRQAQWCKTVVSAPRRLRQGEDCLGLEVSLGYTARPCLKKKKTFIIIM
jgi:hypothetical protein